ncbi:transcription factor IIIC subunit delta N-term-domain-containing protein [Crucibulum laeve]|uniref:Transcription factor IIIC subunit delta N-term-domain-containing protein n=1 Tax=Crucibulum laeve TaxID=68775 RepID=A0A5C3LSY4_9AGAR|nr:transcription factor IIIC subunit delta N-term-domain-containing protein [Crucibulum laeve]
MTSLPIFTALNVPTVTSYPSIKCLQWSADGQVCFLTKTAAYIMTPDHGINFDNSSVVKASLSKDTRDDEQALGWFRTIIQLEKLVAFRWPEYSQEWGAASLGSIDVTMWAVAISPSSLSPDAGCILACLSSNMDLTLWTAAKNCLKGEWIKIYDITPFLLETYSPSSSASSVSMSDNMTNQTLKAQVVSILWTPQPDFGVSPTPGINGSLLIAGSRAGTLILLRYKENQTVEHVHTIPVTDKWLSSIAFSGWDLVGERICEGYVACGTSAGSIHLVKIRQTLQLTPSPFPFGPQCSIDTEFENIPDAIYGSNQAYISALQWVDVPNRGQILVHCKPGILNLWSAPEDGWWSGYRSFLLQNQKISSGSSPLHPASGISYEHRSDRLILTLCDGSFHVVQNFSRDPSWEVVPQPQNGVQDDLQMHVDGVGDSQLQPEPPANVAERQVTSASMSKIARKMFIRTQGGDVDRTEVNRITGAMKYDRSGAYLWVHEASRPSDFSYKHDAKHNNTLVLAQMWEESSDEADTALLQDLQEVLDGAKTCLALAPLHLLRPTLFRLRNEKKLNALLPRLLDILRADFPDHSVNIEIPRYEPGEVGLTPELRREFRRSLIQHLFGWDVLLRLRMRLGLADFAWKLSDSDEKRDQCGLVAQGLLNNISHRILRSIIRHLVSVVDVLTPSDVPFVLRMVVQSLLPGSPSDLSQEGRHLSALVEGLVAAMQTEGAESDALHEGCPACRVEVPLQDITTAVCPNGHTWARCSVTTFILSTPCVRTCIGCSRKAFLPSSASGSVLPAVAQGWVVEELLEAVHRCLFCNNSFVNVL